MGAYPGADPVRLLRSIIAQQAHGRVGSIVFPFAAATPGGARARHGALRGGVVGAGVGGALTVNDCVPLEVAARLPFGRAPYRLAPAAVGLLEMA